MTNSKFQSQITIKDLFEVRDVICYVKPEILNEGFSLTFNSKKETALYLVVLDGKITRCFITLWNIRSLDEINFQKPIYYKIGDDLEKLINFLESADDLLEVHWLKNKIKLVSLPLDVGGLPNLMEIVKMEKVE